MDFQWISNGILHLHMIQNCLLLHIILYAIDFQDISALSHNYSENKIKYNNHA